MTRNSGNTCGIVVLDKWAGIISKYGVVPQESLLLVHKCVVGITNYDMMTSSWCLCAIELEIPVWIRY
jgi:hypothetical protein